MHEKRSQRIWRVHPILWIVLAVLLLPPFLLTVAGVITVALQKI